MTKLEELVEILKICITNNDNACRKICNKRREIADYREKYLIAKTTGTTLGVIGGVGLMLAPFTAGTSLVVSLGAGIAGTATGIGVNIVTDIIDSKETKEFIEDLNRFNTSRSEDLKKLTKLMDELSGIIEKHVELGIPKERATALALREFGGYSNFGSLRLVGMNSAFFGGGFFQAPISLSVAMYATISIVYLFAQSTKMELTGGLKALGLAGQGMQIAKGAAKGVAVVAGVVFIAVDVGLLIKDFTSDNQATGAAYRIEEQIQDQTKTLTGFRNELLEFIQTMNKNKREYSSSSSSSDDDCTCEPITISVLYCNMQSANPTRANATKLAHFRGIVSQKRPKIVALVETWLTGERSDQEVKSALGLEGYQIFRNERSENVYPGTDYATDEAERRGGGMLVAWRNDQNSQQTGRLINFDREELPNLITSSNDNLQSFAISCWFNCATCNRTNTVDYSFRLVYRRPGAYQNQDSQEFRELDAQWLSLLLDYYQGSGGILAGRYRGGIAVGDFNWTIDAGRDIASNIYKLGLVFAPPPTHKSGTSPDIIFDYNGMVERPVDNLGFVSDHAALHFNLKLGKDYDQNRVTYGNTCDVCD